MLSNTDKPKRGRPPKTQEAPTVDPLAQDLANRIWAGQSIDAISRAERLARVKAGLERQGFSMDGIVL